MTQTQSISKQAALAWDRVYKMGSHLKPILPPEPFKINHSRKGQIGPEYIGKNQRFTAKDQQNWLKIREELRASLPFDLRTATYTEFGYIIVDPNKSVRWNIGLTYHMLMHEYKQANRAYNNIPKKQQIGEWYKLVDNELRQLGCPDKYLERMHRFIFDFTPNQGILLKKDQFVNLIKSTNKYNDWLDGGLNYMMNVYCLKNHHHTLYTKEK